MKLTNRRVVVTGSSQGMGLEIAKAFSQHGASVVVNARGTDANGQAKLQGAAEEVSAQGGRAIAFAGDVSEPGVAEQLVAACVEAVGGIDILVNNAGVHSEQPIQNCSIGNWRTTMSVNLDGPFLTSRAAAPHMIAQRWGRIINATSGAAQGGNGGTAYPASKAGLIGLTYAMARDLGMYGITVNGYNPQARTPMSYGGLGEGSTEVFQSAIREFRKRGFYSQAKTDWLLGMTPANGIPRWILYLCLDKANYINGEIFYLDGRRVGLASQSDEMRTLLHDYSRLGPFELDELEAVAPTFFPLENRWPLKADAEIAEGFVSANAPAGKAVGLGGADGPQIQGA